MKLSGWYAFASRHFQVAFAIAFLYSYFAEYCHFLSFSLSPMSARWLPPNILTLHLRQLSYEEAAFRYQPF
jgi:hypothetical protein